MSQILKEFVESLAEKKKKEEDLKKMKVILNTVSANQKDILYNLNSDPNAVKATVQQIKILAAKKKKEDAIKEKEKFIELKRKTQPYWKLYLSFWYDAIKGKNDLIEKEIKNLFETKITKKELNETFERVDEIIESIPDSKNKDQEGRIKEIIRTKTLIYEQFSNKFVDRIKHNIYKLNFPNTIIESESKKVKINEENINKKLEFTKEIFLQKITDLYLQSKQ